MSLDVETPKGTLSFPDGSTCEVGAQGHLFIYRHGKERGVFAPGRWDAAYPVAYVPTDASA